MDLELMATQAVHKALEKGWKLSPPDFEIDYGHTLMSPWGIRKITIYYDQITFRSWLRVRYVEGHFGELKELIEEACRKKEALDKQRKIFGDVSEVAKWLEESWL